MVMAMGTVALAADMSGEGGVIGEFVTEDTPATYSTSVKIYKEIAAYNPESVTVNAPTITYNYTIGAANIANNTTVTDNSSRHEGTDVTATVAVKAGVGTPTITGTAAGVLAITPSDQLKASEYGTANRFDLTVDFSSVNWATTGTGAGVYRYVINETTTETTKNAAGIAEGSAANELFMDVYVDGSGKIYGYVLFTNNTSIDGSASEDSAATTAGKVEGFVDDNEKDHVYTSSEESTADKYYTFNVEVSKDVQNDAYAVSTNHQFPFDFTFANSDVTAAVLPKVSHTGTATYTAPTTAAAITSFSFDGTEDTPTNNLNIADAAVVSIVGIPSGTTVTIKEKNDVPGVTYTSVSEGAAETNAATKSLNTGDASNEAIINGTSHITRATKNYTGTDNMVLFTNTLLQISPTGVVLRVAPYILMLSAGIMLFVLSRKRRSSVED